MEFCHSCLFGAITPEAYEVIFEEILRGEQSISVRFDEIEYAWKVIDALKLLHFPYIRMRVAHGDRKKLNNLHVNMV